MSRFIQIMSVTHATRFSHEEGERVGDEHYTELHALDDEGRVWCFNGKTWEPLPMDRADTNAEPA